MLSPLKLSLLAGGLHAALSAAFTNPIRSPGPDPSIIFVDGYYHMTYTTYDHIEITRSRSLGGLSTGETRTIWTDKNTTRNADMWATEIHEIDSVWYMFYSSCDATLPCCDSCTTRVLRGCEGPNPYDCSYSYLADLVPSVGKQAGAEIPFSIDGTFLDIPNKGRYHVLSVVIGSSRVQSIAITKLDTKEWTVDEWHIISTPDQPWEMNYTGVPINEAPHPLYHNGQVWLSYSGSSCGTPGYALGLLHYKGGDPLHAASWEKSGPLVSTANGNVGTGHNCFFNSPDGSEIWNAFHATANPEGSCGGDRFSVAQKITFDATGWPQFGIPPSRGAEEVPPSGEDTLLQSSKLT